MASGNDTLHTSHTGRRGWPFAVLVGLAVIALAGVTVSLAGLEIDRTPDPAAGAANLRRLTPFWVTSALAWLALGGIGLLVRGAAPAARPGPTIVLVIAVAVAARVGVLAGHDPALSDDVYRYVFDGRNGAAGVNPYLVRPSDRAEAVAERYVGERALVARVNNPELHTIYLPTAQWLFAATALPLRGVADPDAGARAIRVMLVVVEIAGMLLLATALHRGRRSPWWLALYAWHPLPLAEIAGSEHQDVLGVTLVIAALAAHSSMPRAWARWIPALALAGLVKPVAIPVAAFLLRGRAVRHWLLAAVLGAVVAGAVAAPLLLTHGGVPLANLRATATRFSLKWAHFGGVYEPVLTAIERARPGWTNDPQEQLARGICTAILVVVAVVVWRRRDDAWAATAAVFLAMVVLSPAAHPWYLLWSLALVPMAPSLPVWFASLTLPWGYAALADTVDWTVPPWLIAAAFAPIGLAIVVRPVRLPWKGARR